MQLVDLLAKKGVPFLSSGHHHCRPGWTQLDCPFCGDGSEKYHLGFQHAHRYFHCWKCGGHGVFHVLRALGFSAAEIKEFTGDTEDTTPAVQKIRGRLKRPAGVGPLLPAHQDYLRSRGFDPALLVRQWKLGGIGISPRLGWRVFIPIFHQGREVSWTTRAIGKDVAQRYISASAEQEAINHKEVVYGADACAHSIVVVEGPADAWAVGPGAGALFGTAYSLAQVRRIASFPRRIICFDSSAPAQKQAVQLAQDLSLFPGVTLSVCLDAKDPGEASPKEINLLRKIAHL